MEALKMKKMVAFALMIVLLTAVSTVSAADAPSPAPVPHSDASVFVPTFFASFASLAFALLF